MCWIVMQQFGVFRSRDKEKQQWKSHREGESNEIEKEDEEEFREKDHRKQNNGEWDRWLGGEALQQNKRHGVTRWDGGIKSF